MPTNAQKRADKVFAEHQMILDRAFPGPDYQQILRGIYNYMAPFNHLEIGIAHGESLATLPAGTVVRAVDPDYVITADIKASLRLYRMKSKDLFEREDIQVLVLDTAFIDGSHHWEDVVDDFLSVMARMPYGGLIILHDTLPVIPEIATDDRTTLMWVGTAWKAALALIEDGLTHCTIPCYPSGLTVFWIPPEQEVLSPERIKERAAGYEFNPVRDIKIHNIVPNTVEAFKEWIQGMDKGGVDDTAVSKE